MVKSVVLGRYWVQPAYCCWAEAGKAPRRSIAPSADRIRARVMVSPSGSVGLEVGGIVERLVQRRDEGVGVRRRGLEHGVQTRDPQDRSLPIRGRADHV